MPDFFAKTVLLPQGWGQDVLISTNEKGWVTAVAENAVNTANAQSLDGIVLPGMANLHSHAFQYAFAGKSEYATATQDSFWTWRKLMYDFLQTLSPDDVEDIATRLYTKMRQAGYTHVGEFHYLHHNTDGQPYEDRNLMAHHLIKAARNADIDITLLPVLYCYSGFGAQPPEDGQKRFINTPDHFVDMVSTLHHAYQNSDDVTIGMAFHSLRAIAPDMLSEVSTAVQALNPNIPIHIHVAEQQKEVTDCETTHGQRPITFLFDNVAVKDNWCLIHATHMTADEIKMLAHSNAVAGLCPTTEANLGDGVFPLADYMAHGGRWGIGSDSHISVNMVEELRWLEYGQRLAHQKRAIARTDDTPHVGDYLYKTALNGGAQAMGTKTAAIAPNHRAKFIQLKNAAEIDTDFALDQLVFTDNFEIIAPPL